MRTVENWEVIQPILETKRHGYCIKSKRKTKMWPWTTLPIPLNWLVKSKRAKSTEIVVPKGNSFYGLTSNFPNRKTFWYNIPKVGVTSLKMPGHNLETCGTWFYETIFKCLQSRWNCWNWKSNSTTRKSLKSWSRKLYGLLYFDENFSRYEGLKIR